MNNNTNKSDTKNIKELHNIFERYVQKQHQQKRKKVDTMILGAIATTKQAFLAMLAPRLYFRYQKKLTKRQQAVYRYKLKSRLRDLVKEGSVVWNSTEDGKSFLELTEKGQAQFLEEMSLEIHKQLDEDHVWDGKWHLVSFDIPEKLRKRRNILREHLVKVGFIQIQQSVWIYPYDCYELILLIKTHFRLGKHVVYAVVEHLENDKKYRNLFSLE